MTAAAAIPFTWEPLTAVEVADMLKVPKRRVRQLGIPAVQLGPNTLRWLREDVETWVRKRRIGAAKRS